MDRALVRFVLNSAKNVVVTPALRKLWGYYNQAWCQLCGDPVCTLNHILSSCNTALKQGRFTWRHDSVLLTLKPFLTTCMESANGGSSRTKPAEIPPLAKSFVREGLHCAKSGRARPKSRPTLLTSASDWELLIDLPDSKLVVPPEICSTSERPDVLVWSRCAKTVIVGELTCPAEEGISDAHQRKLSKYQKELIPSMRSNGWTVHFLPFEVGTRGYVALSLKHFLDRIGLRSREATKAIRAISLVAAKCSYHVYLSMDTKEWSSARALLDGNEVAKCVALLK